MQFYMQGEDEVLGPTLFYTYINHSGQVHISHS